MKPRYKVGDEVTIKSWEEIKVTLDDSCNYKGDHISFVSSMHSDLGKTYKITEILEGLKNVRYQLNGWWYVEDWIKPKEVSTKYSNNRIIFFMCLQLLSGNRPDKSIFKNRIPFKHEGGFNWSEFQEKVSMQYTIDPLPNWPILTLDIDFAELILTRIKEYSNDKISLNDLTGYISDIIYFIVWDQTPEGTDFWFEKWSYYNTSVNVEKLKQPYKIENHEIKLQRKKSTVIRGTVPEGSITRGRKRKVAITVGYLSNTVCIGG